MDWGNLAAAGFAGLGLGIGLVIGTSVVRMLRKFTRESGNGNGH